MLRSSEADPVLTGIPVFDDVPVHEDLASWLIGLTGCPPITRTLAAACTRPAHDGSAEPLTWFYVEADPRAGVARLRCLACGFAHALLDSDDRWTFPPAWSCGGCRQSIAEVGFGVHDDDRGHPTWVAVAVRCVQCGEIAGVTDLLLRD